MIDFSINYQGPDLDSLPTSISDIIRPMIEKLPPNTTLELSRYSSKPGQEEELMFDPRDYKVVYASDNRGVVQAIFFEGEETYNVRIVNELTLAVDALSRKDREDIMGYDKAKLDVLFTPEQSKADPLAGYHWLIEGQRRE